MDVVAWSITNAGILVVLLGLNVYQAVKIRALSRTISVLRKVVGSRRSDQ